MQPNTENTVVGLLGYALYSGLIKDGRVELDGKLRELEQFGTAVIRAAKAESDLRKEEFDEAKLEKQLQYDAGYIDAGQDGDDFVTLDSDFAGVRTPPESSADGGVDGGKVDARFIAMCKSMGIDSNLHYTLSASAAVGDGEAKKVDTCFATMCKYMGVSCDPHFTSVSQLDADTQAELRDYNKVMIAYDWFAQDDPRNHVVAVVKGSKTAVVTITVSGGDGTRDCIHGITSPQEFFNPGGRFYKTKFYSGEGGDDTLTGDEGFGGDTPVASERLRRTQAPTQRPPPPESVVNGGASGGGANVTGGVVRPKRRAIKARGNYDVTAKTLRNYNVVGVTMFNNAEELFLNTISREYAQEIIEDLFSVWELPTEQAATMKYAEDLLWTFMIARTASNKADYNVILDVPTSKGGVEINFDRFSRLLADKYGITRRNFARGVSDDLREFMRREENQFLRSRAAQRIGADPQMGDLCFDGSTGCSGLTSAETTFTRLLESRNLYERDDVIAEGASDRLMQGVHGGVRSIVPR